ncbi:MAG TPA: hypothetical protein VII49_09870 [Rhizomicrobium sp.]
MTQERKSGHTNGPGKDSFRIERGGYVPMSSGSAANPPRGSGVANIPSPGNTGSPGQSDSAQNPAPGTP